MHCGEKLFRRSMVPFLNSGDLAKPKDISIVWCGIVENSKDSKVVKWIRNDSFRWLIEKGKSVFFWEGYLVL